MKTKKNIRVPVKYLPKQLSKKDRMIERKMLKKSRKLYKKKIYYTRKTIKSFKSKKSSHIKNAKNMYNVTNIGATNELSRKTKCSKKTLAKIINKGEGAYFSSGSRPNQTSKSWGIARLASAITSGRASVVDYDILEKGCKPNSIALKLAKNAKKKYDKYYVKKVKL